MNRLTVENFLEDTSGIPVLDVRSEGEYGAGHIQGAISFPLFNDAERAIIGTLYKQEGRKAAIKKGLEITGPKLSGFIERAEALNSQTLALYCWRGGMRSESMAWLLERYDFETIVLEGGYKAYRSLLLDFFEQPLPLRVVTGYTGSKKTAFLYLLQDAGEQIIDLEGIAGHQGSSFGNKKSRGQPTTEQFQNLLFEAFRKLDIHQPIWIEDESIRIGQVNLPDGLYCQKNEKPHVFLAIDSRQRRDFLVEDYGNLSKEQLIEATQAIHKKLGSEKSTLAIQYIQEGELQRAAEIILTYYDAMYDKSLSSKRHLISEHYQVNMNELPALAIKLANSKIHEV